MSDEGLTAFKLRIDDGPEIDFEARNSIYSLAVMEAFGKLDLPYPCAVEIWAPHLVRYGYGPYLYRIDDFTDMHGNRYGCPAILTASRVPE